MRARTEPIHRIQIDVDVELTISFRDISYPKSVWSPAGGWWHDPVNWKRNTMVLVAGIGLVGMLIFNKGRSLENWHGKTPVPSWSWNTNPDSEHRKNN